jgi:hypothetical protein
MSITIVQQVTIKSTEMKRTWKPDTVIIDGHTYIKLKRTDIGFARFVYGDWQPARTLGPSIGLSELQQLRTDAWATLQTPIAGDEQVNLFSENPLPPKKLRMSRIEIKETRAKLTVATIKFPDFCDIHGIEATVVVTPHASDVLTIKMDGDVLQYIKLFMMAQGCSESRERHLRDADLPKGASWNHQRNGYLLRWVDTGVKKSKMFAISDQEMARVELHTFVSNGYSDVDDNEAVVSDVADESDGGCAHDAA